jgi:molybdate transport system substrate-binding protein
VADRLDIGDAVRQKDRTACGGKEAIELMVKSNADAIGLTQISEALSVNGVVLVGPYPSDLQTMTTYTGILLTRTPPPEAAEGFLRFPTSPPVQARFQKAEFEPPR